MLDSLHNAWVYMLLIFMFIGAFSLNIVSKFLYYLYIYQNQLVFGVFGNYKVLYIQIYTSLAITIVLLMKKLIYIYLLSHGNNNTTLDYFPIALILY